MQQSEGLADSTLLQVLHTSPDAVVVFTPSARVVYANSAVEPVFGWPPAELVGSNIADLLHPDDLGQALASVDAFDEQGARARTAALMRFRWPDGSYASLEVNGNPIVLDGGRTLYSMFGRRAEERRIMAETVELLAHDFDIAAALQLIFEQWSWPLDRALTAFVWEDDRGERRVFGDELPPQLIGLTTAGEPGSPWRSAWDGRDVGGSADELPPRLQELAGAHELRAFRVHPVHDDGRVSVLVTLWAAGTSHPLPVFENRLQFVSRLIQVTLRFAEQQRRLVHDAAHDVLTGLANRRRFFEAVQAAEAERSPRPAAVLYIDLDGFKPVNDKWGHAAGDAALVEVASRLAASCRDGDVVARLGGDEFGVLCPDCTVDDARAIAERFLAALRSPIDVGHASVSLSASIGVATASSHHDLSSYDALMRRADEALYVAKRDGGQRTVVSGAG